MDGTTYQTWNAFFVSMVSIFLSVYVDDIKLAGKKPNVNPMWKKLMKLIDLG